MQPHTWWTPRTTSNSYNLWLQVRDKLVQSERSLPERPRPLPVDVNGAEPLPGTPEAAACQVTPRQLASCSGHLSALSHLQLQDGGGLRPPQPCDRPARRAAGRLSP